MRCEARVTGGVHVAAGSHYRARARSEHDGLERRPGAHGATRGRTARDRLVESCRIPVRARGLARRAARRVRLQRRIRRPTHQPAQRLRRQGVAAPRSQ